MTTVASFRNSEYETTCTKCREPLIAPEWSEYVSEKSVLNLCTARNAVISSKLRFVCLLTARQMPWRLKIFSRHCWLRK